MTAFLNEHHNGAWRMFTGQKHYKPRGCLTVIVACIVLAVVLYHCA